jgi:hypothetical protein
MSYIGYTPQKKLKKLFLLSREIIKHFGMRYFIFVVRLELKKQGLGMFSLDEKPIDAVSNPLFQEKYLKLLEHFKEKFTNELLHQKEFSYLPTVRIIIIFNKNNIDQLQHTINSIQNQSYQNWNILLFFTDSNDVISLPSRIKITSKISISQSKGSAKKFYGEIMNSKYDLIGFLKPGNLLDSFALSQFVLELN